MSIEVSESLQSAYDEQYSDEMTGWRRVGARYKAENIAKVCEGLAFSKVLDCGAGEGSVLSFLDEARFASSLYAVDISDSAIRQIRRKSIARLADVRKFDGYDLPYGDAEFDLVYCSHVLEHVEHPRLLLREMKRVAKYQVMEVPLDYSPHVDDKVDQYLAYGHINIFTPSTFKFLLKSEGFAVHRELLTHLPVEVVRYDWYQNKRLTKTPLREVKLLTLPLRHFVKRHLVGMPMRGDYGYAAFTCLTSAHGALSILS
jgi:ubiquinone/menaquinone biosynthesis C-methylase UbiE